VSTAVAQAGMVTVPPVSRVKDKPPAEVTISSKVKVILIVSPELYSPLSGVEVIEVIAGGVLSKLKVVAVAGVSTLAELSVALD
jgi:hypothetical protein